MRTELTGETAGRDLARVEELDEMQVLRALYVESVRVSEDRGPPTIEQVRSSQSAKEALRRKQPLSTPFLRALAQQGEW